MRLDKYLSDLNAGTRKEIREAVRRGRVRVNGETASDPGMRLSGAEEVLFDGRRMIREEHVYYMMNKPAGVVCAVTDAKCRTVLDLMGAARRKDLFPVGRLDKDTVGLLLLTNDGQFDHRLMSPRRHVEKTYFVRVDGDVSGDDVRAFSKGLQVDEDFTALPAKLEIARSAEVSEVYLTIREGKYHQVKRMFHAVGKEVIMLKRVSIGALVLDPDLQEGCFRPLREEELDLPVMRTEREFADLPDGPPEPERRIFPGAEPQIRDDFRC